MAVYLSFHLGTRGLESMREAEILPSFAGIVVSDRYAGCYSETWANFARPALPITPTAHRVRLAREQHQ